MEVGNRKAPAALWAPRGTAHGGEAPQASRLWGGSAKFAEPEWPEAVAIAEALEPMEREAARKRRLATLAQNRSGKFTEREQGQSLDKVASGLAFDENAVWW